MRPPRIRSFMPMVMFLAPLLGGCGGEGDVPVPTRELGEAVFDTVAIIGAIEGQPWEVFARIRSVAVAENGRFAVLDDQSPMLALFDASGNFLSAVAQRGQGPGELGRPWEVVWTRAGDLLVLDPANARISRYGVDDRTLVPMDSRRLQVFGDGFCLLEDRVFVSARWNDGLIHELGEDGNAAWTFGAAPELEVAAGLSGVLRDIAMEQLAPGRLLCDSRAGTILEVGRLNPRVQLHGADGSLRWSTELEGLFSLVPVVSPDGRGLGMRPNEETGAHSAESVLPWGEGRVLIQYAHVNPPAVAGTESRLLRLDTGEEEERVTHLPYFIAAAGDRFIHIRNSPVPQVVVLQRR